MNGRIFKLIEGAKLAELLLKASVTAPSTVVMNHKMCYLHMIA